MRVLEKGLHALANELIRRFYSQLDLMVDDAMWGPIIGEIHKTLNEPDRLNKSTPQLTKTDKRFYSKASIQFEYFRAAWRNDVSPSRSDYDPNEAKSVREHVERFMKQIAAEGLTETV